MKTRPGCTMPEIYAYPSMRVVPSHIKESLDHIKTVLARFNPKSPFSYNFLDDRIAALYRNEARMMQMFSYFSIFAIFISCLGLFGLASFTATRRTKEIGVRKVLGASFSNTVALLSREFIKWVLLANIIAWPIAFFAMKDWLNDFAYRVNISWMEFVMAAVLTFVISVLTISYQSIKAAAANPIDSLRYE